VADRCVSESPRLVYDKGRGLIVLTDGQYEQVVARPDGMCLYIMWKRTKQEIKVSIDHLLALIVQAGE